MSEQGWQGFLAAEGLERAPLVDAVLRAGNRVCVCGWPDGFAIGG